MKELSIEEKAKRYDEAIALAKDSFNYPSYPGFIRVDVVFPELAESEDERIRKALIDYFDDANKADENPLQSYGVHTDKAIAWLKKQGEQKPVDLPNCEDYGIDGLYAAIDILQKTLGEVEGYQSDDGILTHKCAISAVKELSKQKPTWSEEDEKVLKETINTVLISRNSCEEDDDVKDRFDDELRWLKSLKNRIGG